MPKLRWTFLAAALLGAAAVLALAFLHRPAGVVAAVTAKPLVPGLFIAEQVAPAQLPDLVAKGFKSIVDLRPDGEATDQPSSAAMADAARRAGLAFAYVPVAHGDIPAASVQSLERALAGSDRPVLLYCRSGKRAARTWALAEAARTGGLDAAAIEAAVQSAGQSVDDLKASIDARIAMRPPQ